MIFPAMFGNLIDGSQNAVWLLVLEGEILQIYENRSNRFYSVCMQHQSIIVLISGLGRFRSFFNLN